MVDWINISQDSGSGNAIITVTASSYNELLERSTSLNVRTANKSAIVGITQRFDGSFNITPSSLVFDFTGETESVYIECVGNWTLTTPAWITASQASGNGNTTITLTASHNNSNERTGTVTLYGNNNSRTLSVRQYEYEEPIITVTINESLINIPSSGGNGVIIISSLGDWTLSTPEWIIPSQEIGGSGSSRVTLVAMPNTGDTLSGYVTASTINSSDTCAVVQEGYYVYHYADADFDNFESDPYGGEYTIGIDSNASWTATTTVFWIDVTPTSGNSGYNRINITLDENNTGSQRVGYVVITDIETNVVLTTIEVVQAAKAGVDDYLTIIFTGNTPNTYYEYDENAGEIVSFTSQGSGWDRLDLRVPINWNYRTPETVVEFNKNNTGWQSVNVPRMYSDQSTTLTTVQDGDVIKLRSVKSVPYMFEFHLKAVVQGNPKSMIYGDDYATGGPYVFAFDSMFAYCPVVSSKGILFNDDIVYRYTCFSMFKDCSLMTDFPSLPATTLSQGCYDNMFYGCKSLTSAPYIPVRQLGYSVYIDEENGWDADDGEGCFESMFARCYGLTLVPNLPMIDFSGHNDHACHYMFQNCTGLTHAPKLPSTNLCFECYKGMFERCTSLTTPPALPSTTLAEGCYEGMFKYCSALTETPVLPAIDVPNYAYREMFGYCSSLSKITCYAVNLGTNATSYWTRDVAQDGVFVKNADATWSWGTNGIPYSWTVEDA